MANLAIFLSANFVRFSYEMFASRKFQVEIPAWIISVKIIQWVICENKIYRFFFYIALDSLSIIKQMTKQHREWGKVKKISLERANESRKFCNIVTRSMLNSTQHEDILVRGLISNMMSVFVEHEQKVLCKIFKI